MTDGPLPPSSNTEAYAFVSTETPAAAEPLASNHGVVAAKAPNTYRVLHTADWHLGKYLVTHSRVEEHDCFFNFLLQAIGQHEVDALIIAGDVFDTPNPPQTAVRQYYNFLARLRSAGACSVVIVAGNHDSPSHLEAPREVLQSLSCHVVGTLAARCEDWLVALPNGDDAKLVVVAMPFLRDADLRVGMSGQNAEEIRAALAAGINRCYTEAARAARAWQERGVPVLATGHLTVVGSKSSDSERDIHVGGLGAVTADCFSEIFAYVALGHLHRPQSAGGRQHVRYSGSPLALSFSEADDSKEVRILDFADGGLVGQWALPVPCTRRLVRVKGRYENLAENLVALATQLADNNILPCWVEVTLENTPVTNNLFEEVRRLTEPHGLELIRITLGTGNKPAGLTIAEGVEAGADDAWLAILEDPKVVFDRRLEAEKESLATEDHAALTTAFAELCELHAAQHREAA